MTPGNKNNTAPSKPQAVYSPPTSVGQSKFRYKKQEPMATEARPITSSAMEPADLKVVERIDFTERNGEDPLLIQPSAKGQQRPYRPILAEWPLTAITGCSNRL